MLTEALTRACSVGNNRTGYVSIRKKPSQKCDVPRQSREPRDWQRKFHRCKSQHRAELQWTGVGLSMGAGIQQWLSQHWMTKTNKNFQLATLSKKLPPEREHHSRLELAVRSAELRRSGSQGCCIVSRTHHICRAVLQTLEAIAEYGMPCQMTDRGNHGEFTRFFAVCIKNVIRHNAMRRPLYQQQQAQRTKKRIWLGCGTSLRTPMSEVVPVELSWRGERTKNPWFHLNLRWCNHENEINYGDISISQGNGPWAFWPITLSVNLKGRPWVLDDYYSINSKCICMSEHPVNFTFNKIKNNNNKNHRLLLL